MQWPLVRCLFLCCSFRCRCRCCCCCCLKFGYALTHSHRPILMSTIKLSLAWNDDKLDFSTGEKRSVRATKKKTLQIRKQGIPTTGSISTYRVGQHLKLKVKLLLVQFFELNSCALFVSLSLLWCVALRSKWSRCQWYGLMLTTDRDSSDE